MITPVCTETPNSARKPTPEETLKLVCVSSSASIPPSGAIATLPKISSAHLPDLNIVYRITKMMMIVTGSTSINRLEDRFWLSYSPAQSNL